MKAFVVRDLWRSGDVNSCDYWRY